MLSPSTTPFTRSPSRHTTILLRLLSSLGLVRLSIHPGTGEINETTNMTILNVFLVRLGPMNEKRLVKVLIGTQVSYSDYHNITPHSKYHSWLPALWLLLLDMALLGSCMTVIDVENDTMD